MFGTQWGPAPGGGELWLTESSDEGDTWSKPTVLWKDEDSAATLRVAAGMQTLSSGEVLLPVARDVSAKRSSAGGPVGSGQQLRMLRRAVDGRWGLETPGLPTPWELSGPLWLATDNQLVLPGRGGYFESADSGRTWKRGTMVGPMGTRTSVFEIGSRWIGVSAIDSSGPVVLPANQWLVRSANQWSADGGATWSPVAGAGERYEPATSCFRGESGSVLLGRGSVGPADDGPRDADFDFLTRQSAVLVDSDGRNLTMWCHVAGDPPLVPVGAPVAVPLSNKRVLVVVQASAIPSRASGLARDARLALIANVFELP